MKMTRTAVAVVLLVLALAACQPRTGKYQTWRPDKTENSDLHCWRYPSCPTTPPTTEPPLHPF